MHSKNLDKYKLERFRKNLSFCHSRWIFSICHRRDPRGHIHHQYDYYAPTRLFLKIFFCCCFIKPRPIKSIFKESQSFFFVFIFKFSKEQHRLQALRWRIPMYDDNKTMIQYYTHSSKSTISSSLYEFHLWNTWKFGPYKETPNYKPPSSKRACCMSV